MCIKVGCHFCRELSITLSGFDDIGQNFEFNYKSMQELCTHVHAHNNAYLNDWLQALALCRNIKWIVLIQSKLRITGYHNVGRMW